MQGIRLEGLTKHYKRGGEIIRALDGVTLDIEPGEFIAVVGRSGSGKTTMLDLLGLLLKPTAGKLFIAHVQVNLSRLHIQLDDVAVQPRDARSDRRGELVDPPPRRVQLRGERR